MTTSVLAVLLDNLWQRLHGGITFWTLFGLVGNALFASRFFVQWYVSERRRASVIPVSFWWLSLVGGVITTVYAVHLGSVPYILGVLPPNFIYLRNLVLIARGKRAAAAGPTAGDVSPASAVAPTRAREAAPARP